MDLTALDSWSSLSRAIAAVAILLCIAKLLGGALVGRDPSVPLQLIVGTNCIGLFGLALGWLPQPIPTMVVCVGASVFVFHVMVSRFRPRNFERQSRGNSLLANCRSALSGWSVPQVLGLFALLITLGPALAYPSGWDELVYHVELPRRWLNFNSLSVQGDLPYSALPSLPEIICWLVAPIEHLVAPRLLGWVTWVNGILVFRESLRRVASVATAEVLVWAVVASRVSLMISANFYVESFLWADTAALCSLLLFPKAIERRSFYVAGVVVGAALATKMTAIGLAAFLPVAWWLMQSRKILTVRQVLFGLWIALLFAFPFYLRAWVLCGNPFSPYFAGWFTADRATQLTSEFHHELAVGNFGIPGWLGFIAAPIALAFAREVYDGTFGIQWLAVLVLCGLACRALVGRAAGRRAAATGKRTEVIAAFILCGLLYVVWFVSSQQARFAVSLLMVAVFACAHYIDELKHGARRALLVCISVLTIVSVPWTNSGYYLDSWLCVLRVFAPIDYIRDGVGDSYTELAVYLHTEVPRDSKVVTLFEHRLAYLPPGVEIATPYFQSKYFTQAAIPASTDYILEQLRQQRVKYVVLTMTPAGPDVSQRFIAAQQEWFRGIDSSIASGELKVIWRSENHAVAEVVGESQ